MWRSLSLAILSAAAAGSLLATSSLAAMPGDEPPPLTAPVVNPEPGPAVVPTPAVRTTPTPAPTPTLENRPLLVLPGITRPRSALPRPNAPSVSGDPAPTLAGPGEPSEDAPLPAPAPAANPRPFSMGRRATSRTVESVPDADGGPTTVTPPLDVPSRRMLGERQPAPPPPSPSRRPQGFFGRLLQGDSAKNERARPTPSAARDVPPPPPTTESPADTAFKRRVVKEVREKLGSRVSTFEVRVAGREVLIRAKVPRFWQRRGVRNDLQSLPVLTGYKSAVELVD
jgi:hypothetical protein